VDFLNQYLNLTDDDVYVYDRPLNLPDFMELTRLELPTLKDAPFSPRILQDFQGDNEAIFTAISQNDY